MPSQLELWYQYSDIVVQDVTCKTNNYEMALSLFIILDKNRNIRLVAQTCQQFTARFHASSPVESINAWIKSYIFNSNISLCELGDVIKRRQMAENKKYQLVLWKAAIPCVPTQISTAAFMFISINQKLEEYLPPAILELQRDEIRHKFENEITPLIPQHNVPFLTAICKISQEFITQHEQFTDIQLYGKIAGLSHKATIKAVSKKQDVNGRPNALLQKFPFKTE
ncbi:hypothetical protein C1646_759828 [Rhizophagus diaphanus]|nr:hypothetical protein C1646_759828 [Rhizophagus diaphanus] [Rhizophagus sp. MUCL 43196]